MESVKIRLDVPTSNTKFTLNFILYAVEIQKFKTYFVKFSKDSDKNGSGSLKAANVAKLLLLPKINNNEQHAGRVLKGEKMNYFHRMIYETLQVSVVLLYIEFIRLILRIKKQVYYVAIIFFIFEGRSFRTL